jgi:hypothetical protein
LRNHVIKTAQSFLQSTGLYDQAWDEHQFIGALQKRGLSVVAERIEPRNGVTGAIIKVDQTFVLFYPAHADRLTCLQGLVHEGAHLVLGHVFLPPSQAAAGSSYGPGAEYEAELFTRVVLEQRAARLSVSKDRTMPTPMGHYLRSLSL